MLSVQKSKIRGLDSNAAHKLNLTHFSSSLERYKYQVTRIVQSSTKEYKRTRMKQSLIIYSWLFFFTKVYADFFWALDLDFFFA